MDPSGDHTHSQEGEEDLLSNVVGGNGDSNVGSDADGGDTDSGGDSGDAGDSGDDGDPSQVQAGSSCAVAQAGPVPVSDDGDQTAANEEIGEARSVANLGPWKPASSIPGAERLITGDLSESDHGILFAKGDERYRWKVLFADSGDVNELANVSLLEDRIGYEGVYDFYKGWFVSHRVAGDHPGGTLYSMHLFPYTSKLAVMAMSRQEPGRLVDPDNFTRFGRFVAHLTERNSANMTRTFTVILYRSDKARDWAKNAYSIHLRAERIAAAARPNVMYLEAPSEPMPEVPTEVYDFFRVEFVQEIIETCFEQATATLATGWLDNEHNRTAAALGSSARTRPLMNPPSRHVAGADEYILEEIDHSLDGQAAGSGRNLSDNDED